MPALPTISPGGSWEAASMLQQCVEYSNTMCPRAQEICGSVPKTQRTSYAVVENHFNVFFLIKLALLGKANR